MKALIVALRAHVKKFIDDMKVIICLIIGIVLLIFFYFLFSVTLEGLKIFGPYCIAIAALFVGFKDPIINYFMKPVLDVEFNPDRQEHLHKIVFQPILELDDPISGVKFIIRQPGINTRISVKNIGRTTARNVKVTIEKINVYDKSHALQTEVYYHPSIVKWSGERDFGKVDIAQKSRFFLDLVYIINETVEEIRNYHSKLGEDILDRIIIKDDFSGDIYWNVWIDQSYDRGVPPKYLIDGIFELFYSITADNCKPKKFRIDFSWDKSRWQKPQIIYVK